MELSRSTRQRWWEIGLTLGRVSNLPTVWSNCLAGWWLAGGGSWNRLVCLLLGATAAYLGGMFLNDAFDADYDRVYRRERPIPSGAIASETVLRWGYGLLILAILSWAPLGLKSVTWGILLVAAIIFYNAMHKDWELAPAIMGSCRLLLFLVAAVSARKGITGLALWSGLALATYIMGLSFLARRENAPHGIPYWPIILLTAPLILSLLANGPPHFGKALLFGAVLIIWVGWSLRYTLNAANPNVGLTVSGLLAGIVWVDALAVLGGDHLSMTLAFVLLFASALVMQRLVPAS